MARPIWIADTVHFVFKDHVCRPGIITDMQYPGAPHVNLQVILDGPIYEDGKPPQRAMWIYKVPHSRTIAEGHWHSMQECPYLIAYMKEQNQPQPLVSNPTQQERTPVESNNTDNVVTLHPPPERALPKPLGSKPTLNEVFEIPTHSKSPTYTPPEALKPRE